MNYRKMTVMMGLATGVSSFGLLATPAMAQQAPATATAPAAPAASDQAQASEIVVTGYRASLQRSAEIKKNNVGLTETILAEDIGKFPDSNIAESLNRVPGVTITRDNDGEGVNAAIRGLGSAFTQVTLNGAAIMVGSTGTADGSGTGRQVDLNYFPTELFTSITVEKSSRADILEGGAAGSIDLRTAHPFDRPGTHYSLSMDGIYNTNAGKPGYKGAAVFSTTKGEFGVLVGVSGISNQVNSDGFESIGWTEPNLSAAQNTTSSRNNINGTGSNGSTWSIPGTVPAGAGNGLTTGSTLNQAALLALNPGLSITQLNQALIPRLGRVFNEYGSRKRITGVVSLEYKGDDNGLHLYLDSMLTKARNQEQRIDMDWIVRNGSAIPIGLQVDPNGVVTSGTFANAQSFLEYRPYDEKLTYYGFNPGGEYQATDHLKLELKADLTHSSFYRQSPSVLVATALGSGDTVNYTNNNGNIGIASSTDLDNPANFFWNSQSRVNIQDERRQTTTKGIRGSIKWDHDDLVLRVGAAYDNNYRNIVAYDNSALWQNAVCGNNPNVALLAPNTSPACNGANAPGSAAANYPGYGTGYTAGATTPIAYQGSLIPQSALASYLIPGPKGFVTVNWPAFAAASNYNQFNNSAPFSTSSNTGANSGQFQEKNFGAYVEADDKFEFGDNTLRLNGGVRFIHTNQRIGGYVANGTVAQQNANLQNGGYYPTVGFAAYNFINTYNSYSYALPAFTADLNVGRHAVFRASWSKTLTRPDPNAMLPGVNFSDPSAYQVTLGNPALAPYLSKNLDLGFEYYTGKEGYIAIAAYRKSITGFTQSQNISGTFGQLAQYGININTVTQQQALVINSQGGNNSPISISEQVNAGNLVINGGEFTIVQPLDFLLASHGIKGLGVIANLTVIDQSSQSGVYATGVPHTSYNLTLYYDHKGVSARVLYNYTGGSLAAQGPQNGLNGFGIYSDPHKELDFSSNFDLEKIFGGSSYLPTISLNITNLTKSHIRTYLQYKNATYSDYNPGTTFSLGLREKF
ncbi:MAG: TonB-dependent receptor [Sphingomonadales bacterium]|nr:TonB-dependent receptor [Sphingomonadales bacterium]MDE2168387.1 TonB-dependent receptor [Sphingomonadales bacterium]